MLVSEEEATKKWCPMVRAEAGFDNVAANAGASDRNPAWSHCIGADCMMWRRDPVGPTCFGYCGLGGAPSKWECDGKQKL